MVRKTPRIISALYVLTYYRKHLGIKSEPHKLLMRNLSLSDVTAKRLIAVLYSEGYIGFSCNRNLESIRERIKELYSRPGPYRGFQLAEIIGDVLDDEECSVKWDITDKGLKTLKTVLSGKGLNYDDLVGKPLDEALETITVVFEKGELRPYAMDLSRWFSSIDYPRLLDMVNSFKQQHGARAPIIVESAPAKFVILPTLHEGIRVIRELADERQIRFSIGAGLEFMADREKTASTLKQQRVSIKYKEIEKVQSLYGFFGQHLFNPLVTGFKAYTALYPVFTRGRVAEVEITELLSRWYWPRLTKPRQVLDTYEGVYVKREETKRGLVYEALIPDEVRASFSSVIGYFNKIVYSEVHRALVALGLASTNPKRTVDVINASKAFGTSLVTILWRDLHYAPFPALTGKPVEDYKELVSNHKELWIARMLDKMSRAHALLILDEDVYGSLAWILRLLRETGMVRIVTAEGRAYLLPYSLYQRLLPLERYIGDEAVGNVISALAMLIKSKSRWSLPTEHDVLGALKGILGDDSKAKAYLSELYSRNILSAVYFARTKYILTPFDVPGLLLELSGRPLLSLLINDSILPHIHKLLTLTQVSKYKGEFLGLIKAILEKGEADLIDHAKLALIPEGAALIELLKDLGLEHEDTKLVVRDKGSKELRVILAMLIESIEWSLEGIDEDKAKQVRETSAEEVDRKTLEVLRRTRSVQDQLEAGNENI